MMRIELDRRWVVNLHASFSLPIDAATVWRYMCDFQRFVCLDFFHQAVHLNGPAPRVGTHLRIEHRFVCFAVQRIGRILSWRDGRSYAFSDLSHRPGRGFPQSCPEKHPGGPGPGFLAGWIRAMVVAWDRPDQAPGRTDDRQR